MKEPEIFFITCDKHTDGDPRGEIFFLKHLITFTEEVELLIRWYDIREKIEICVQVIKKMDSQSDAINCRIELSFGLY